VIIKLYVPPFEIMAPLLPFSKPITAALCGQKT